jgi:hypothetical protein
MTVDDGDRRVPEASEPEQPADPFEPEAPAHLDPDPETAAHEPDDATTDGADPAPPQPS